MNALFLTNGGPIDANQSPAANSLAMHFAKLSNYQKDVFLTPRPNAEFFKCKKDPWNKVNLIKDKKYKKEIDKLSSIMQQWQTETGDTVPEGITPDWYDRETGNKFDKKGIRGEMPGQSKNATMINAKGPF